MPENDQHPQNGLLANAVAGDRAALESLLLACYRRLAARVAPKIPARLRDLVSADDVLQETFAEVFRRIGQFEARGEEAFFHWVSAIADQRLSDMIKAQCAAKRGGGRAPAQAAASPAASSVVDLLEMLRVHEHTPSRSAARHEAVAAVQAALNGVREDYRHALHCRYIRGMPVADIAAEMGRTQRAVHMLCNRGLKQLKNLLGASSEFFSRKQ